MKMRRPERAAAALLLAALCASVGLLAHPSGSASASTSSGDTIKVSELRYGCSNGGWVEITINSRADQLQNSSDEQQLFQVGLTAPGSTSPDGPYPDGGPTQVVAGQVSTVVRLAGSANNADAVFIRRVATGELRIITLPGDCRNKVPRNFGLNDPNLKVASVSCVSGSKAHVQAQITNPNELLDPTQELGLTEIDYTVLLVRTADNALMAPTQGELVRFNQPGKDSVTMAAPAASAARYELRVIGVDGSVVTSNELAVNCAHVPSGSPTTTRPTPTPTPTHTQTPTPPHPSSPPNSSPPVSHTPPAVVGSPSSSGGGSVIQPTDNGPVINPPGSSSGSVTSAGASLTASGSHSSSAIVTPTTPPTGNTPSSSSASRPNLRILSGDSARNSPQDIFSWNRNVALVVLLDAAAIAALVGATVVSARRR
jgi:hypothetical protein